MRLASLSPAVTEILFALGKGGSLVCRDQFSNFPEEAKGVPMLRGHQDIAVEKLRSFKPDLVFTSTVIQAMLAEKLRGEGFPVIHQDPRNLSDVLHSFIEIGVLVDAEKRAHALSLRMREGLNEVKKRSRVLPRHPRLYIEEWHDPPMASGNWVPEIARVAGGRQFPVLTGELSREVTVEEVQDWNPEMIVLSICGAGEYAEKSLITSRPGWDELPAVQEGRVFVIDDSLLNRPGPRLVEGAQRLYAWMFEMMH